MIRYRAHDEDSARWEGFPFRDGDIVISTRSRSGTTWTQMICALLIFQTPELPAPLGELSPWLDMLVEPRDRVVARLERQTHRRFIKTHTPLDGVPIDPRAIYIVVARHPLDMAVSLYHHSANIDRVRMALLSGNPDPVDRSVPRPSLHDWLVAWANSTADPQQETDSLPGVMWHLSDAWGRRSQPNVVLLRYSDLERDLEGQMRALAVRLGIDVPEAAWPGLVEAARFSAMRAEAAKVSPARGVLLSSEAFFRRGRSGAGAEVLSAAELDAYRSRVARMGPPELVEWLHG